MLKEHKLELFTFPEQELSLIRLYDIHGGSKHLHRDGGLAAFDVMIIVCSGNELTNSEMKLAQYSQHHNQPVLIVSLNKVNYGRLFFHCYPVRKKYVKGKKTNFS